MVIGLICSECISLTKWGIDVQSRAKFAQSHQLQGGSDPQPAIASQKQAQQQFEREFTVKSYRFAA